MQLTGHLDHQTVGNLAEIENRIEKDLGCTLSNLVEYNTYENGTLTLFSL
jgi:hypothetical protein